MLGKWVVSFMKVALNLAALAIIIGCGMFGYTMEGSPIGLVLGVGVGFLLDVIFLGSLFFVMEINNNLIRIEEHLETMSTKLVNVDAKGTQQRAETANKGLHPKEEIIDGNPVIKFLCPKCFGPISITSDHAGRAGKCPYCDVLVDIPVLNKGDRNVA